MSDRLSVGDFSLEITDSEVIVRDQSGAVVQTVDLESLDGALALPDGRTVDVAALLAESDGDVSDFETAAGPGNDSGFGPTGTNTPNAFRAFNDGGPGGFAGFRGAGTLGDTTLSYREIDGDPEAADEEELLAAAATIPVTWSDHEPWQATENQPGIAFGSLVEGDPADFTFTVSDPRFEVVDGILRLKDGVSFDYERESFVDVTVTATSRTGETETQNVRIDVLDQNEGQTDIGLDGASVVENAAGAVIGNLTVVDPDSTDSQSFAVSDPRFEVVNGQLKLKDGISLDFESEPSVDVVVTATDEGGHAISETFTIAVGDVNEAQTALDLDNSTVAENAPGAVIGALTVADPDAGDSQSFAVSDSRFEVVNGQLKLKDGISLDFESEPSVDVVVTATDKGGHAISETFTVAVGNVNEAPMALALSADGAELLKNGSFEANPLNNGQWKLFGAIEGWNTDTKIEIQNNVTNKASDGAQVIEMDSDHKPDAIYQDVQTQAGRVYDLSFDAATRKDTKHTDAIEVYWNGVKIATVDPQSTTWQSHSFSVVGTGGLDRLEFRELASENDSYGGLLDNVSLKSVAGTVPENAAGAIIGDLTVTDPDAGDSHSFAVSDGRFEVVDGQLKLKDGVSLDFETEKSVDVTVTATDSGGKSVTQTFTVSVTNVNESPTVSVTDGSVGNHIVDTSTAYQPTGSQAIGDFLLKGSNGNNAINKFGASQVNGIDPANVTLAAPTEVKVTFQREGAGYHNMVGVYQFDANGKIVPGSVQFVWLDATANKEGQLGASLVKDFLGFAQAGTVSLGTMDAGTRLGFFTIADGASNSSNQSILKALAGSSGSQANAMAAINTQLSIVVDANGNGRVYAGSKQLSGDTYFTHDKSLNTDFGAGKDIEHSLSGISATADGQLIVGFEDLNGGGDRDYEDVVFSVSMGAYNVNKLTQNVVQPSVDFADIDSDALSQAVIHSSGFQPGDALNVPPSSLFDVTVSHSGNDYTISVVGKTGQETVDQYEDFVNSVYFSTSSKAEGDRHIDYSIVDEGGLTSSIGEAKIGVSNSYEISSSELASGQHSLGSGDDHLYLNGSLPGHLDFGDGHDTLHIAQNDASLGHSDFVKLENIEAIDMTGFSGNKVALSIVDVLDMTDTDNRLTVIGDKGDVVTLSGDGSGHHWTVVETGDEFTTYAWSDPIQQAVVEISNQLTANLST
jgi:hypothetical protein